MAEPDRDLVRNPDPAVHPPRHVSSVNVLVKQIRDYINSWNATAKPFTWTATADEVLAKVRLVATNVKKLVNNNSN